MSREEKNTSISNTIKDTRERHAHMICKTYGVKVVTSKLSCAQREELNAAFREAKWLRNDIISDFKRANRNAKTANVKTPDGFEERELVHLGSQIKQDIYDKVKSEIKSLANKKKQGKKVGRLKFKSVCNSLPLRQFGTTYNIYFNENRIKVQKIAKPFYVRGLKQIPDDAEFANATLVRKASGLYFYITCYIPVTASVKTGKSAGIDFGIENNLNFSDDREAVNAYVNETDYIKRLSRKINRCWIRNGKKHSANNRKRIMKLRIAYEKLANQKADLAHKIVHELLSSYDFIAIQDEMLANWHKGLFGKQVQHSCMGLIKAELMKSSKTHVVSKDYPSTQVCPVCGQLTKHPLDKREYDCAFCGYHHNSRDKKSAQSILERALYEVSLEQRAKSLVETESSTPVGLTDTCKIPSMTQEAQVL